MALQLATKRVFLTSLIISICASVILGIVGIFLDRSGRLQERFIFTALFIGLYSLAALGGSIPYDRGHWRGVSGGGIVLAIIGCALTLPMLWLPKLEDSDAYVRFVGVLATATGVCVHTSLISMVRISGNLRWLRSATLVSSVCLALVIGAIIVFDLGPNPWGSVLGFFILLAACGSVMVPIVRVLNKVQTDERVQTLELELTMICPRCHLQQVVNSGRSTCPRCKLRFKIEIEEPRCDKCGYLLYQLTENRCPECGESFEQELVASDAGDEVSGT